MSLAMRPDEILARVRAIDAALKTIRTAAGAWCNGELEMHHVERDVLAALSAMDGAEATTALSAMDGAEATTEVAQDPARPGFTAHDAVRFELDELRFVVRTAPRPATTEEIAHLRAHGVDAAFIPLRSRVLG